MKALIRKGFDNGLKGTMETTVSRARWRQRSQGHDRDSGLKGAMETTVSRKRLLKNDLTGTAVANSPNDLTGTDWQALVPSLTFDK
ncbi:hypothetical protein SK128_023157 [Halocaridina rubra]|uniref:Uncharacterized protein n=1 Tax=Halocaridina rubra TaxID=373956 RepID=A0AAN8W8U1_HALRR